ncbi:hypothetical protein CDG81_17760 [Actinopolyspora erythraea]|uniref:Uncharacterized protein n=1 Tax=Actinopolyspora erythraea TaxID=414996 RepID=A0A099D1I7_9ACTN|nr:hypothetical protein [Actinopolyspora erythraea]ASU79801.1 hypothetical protein CDG81_17760 [Actinopolyspora erythraea]KGI79682.1 hypothetical protein IL38_22315 [Actinopolyspora erythraea]
MSESTTKGTDHGLVALLSLDAFLLAVLELFFLPSYLGSVQFPITAAVAAVTNPLLVAVAARASSNGPASWTPVLVWFLTVFVLGVFGPGGDVLLPAQDWRSYLLIAAGVLPAAAMIGIARHEPPRSG